MASTRARILARRARFVGATLAAAGIGAAGTHACGAAQPCLSIIPAGSEAETPLDPPDAPSPDAGTDEERTDDAPPDAEPHPVMCLSAPEICLAPLDIEDEAAPGVCLRALPDGEEGS